MKKNTMIRISILGFFYVLLVSAALVWVALNDTGQLKHQLTWLSPLSLEINFFLIILAVVLNLDVIKKSAALVSRKAWIILLVIVIAGTAVTAFEAPRIHRIFYDEDIYLNVGQNIAFEKKAGMCNNGETLYGVYSCYQLQYSKEPHAWPYLISLLYRAAGVSHLAVFVLNNIIWALSIVVLFILGLLLFRDERAGLFAAFLLAILPEGIRWSNTTAVEPSAALFGGMALLAVIYYIRHPDKRSLFLAAVILPFAFQFRPESGLILVPAGLALILMAPGELSRQRFYVFILVLIALSLPHIVHLYSVRAESWGAPADSSKFALAHFYKNIVVNAPFYFINRRFPLIVTLLALAGLALPLWRSKTGPSSALAGTTAEPERGRPSAFFMREKSVIVLWFLPFWGIFLFFYAGSYNYGADVRFSLLSQMPVALIGGFGASQIISWLEKRFAMKGAAIIISTLIILSFLSFMPYIRAATQEAWSSRFDHKFAEKIAERIPPHSLIFTHNPNMFLLWGKNAAQASIAMSPDIHLRHFFDKYSGGVYFHYNYWCTVKSEVQPALCRNILKKFDTEKIMEESEKGTEFALYKLELKE